MKKLILSVAIAVILGACTTNPNKIGANYVSPQKYANYDCQQLALEASNIERKVNDLYGHLKKENSKDKWATGVGVVLFWPALFFLAGNENVNEVEYAQLKGEYEAIQSAQVQKKCTISTPATVESPTTSTVQAASVAVAEPESQLRAVTETEKADCQFVRSITRGTGGNNDASANTEKAMNSALSDAASLGADSYYVVNVETSATGASVVLEALNCNL
jgi:hypothetical protein